MYRTLADSKFLCSPPNRGFIFQNIVSKLYSPFFHNALQTDPPTYFLFQMYVEGFAVMTDMQEDRNASGEKSFSI